MNSNWDISQLLHGGVTLKGKQTITNHSFTIKLGEQIAYMHRNSEGPWGIVGPKNF